MEMYRVFCEVEAEFLNIILMEFVSQILNI
jgi:hypothetical protein